MFINYAMSKEKSGTFSQHNLPYFVRPITCTNSAPPSPDFVKRLTTTNTSAPPSPDFVKRSTTTNTSAPPSPDFVSRKINIDKINPFTEKIFNKIILDIEDLQ